jgi:hypothetical protein
MPMPSNNISPTRMYGEQIEIKNTLLLNIGANLDISLEIAFGIVSKMAEANKQTKLVPIKQRIYSKNGFPYSDLWNRSIKKLFERTQIRKKINVKANVVKIEPTHAPTSAAMFADLTIADFVFVFICLFNILCINRFFSEFIP